MRYLLMFAATVELAVGALHFGMPLYYRRAPGLDALPSAADAYVMLVTFAVGILLAAFGTLTLFFARTLADTPVRILRAYLILKSVLWAARLGLEVAYPVQLPMFGIDPFTTVVLPGVLVECLVFVVATWMAFRPQD